MEFVFLTSALVVAACGLVYELLAGTLASYLLGDSVTQFSTVIGVYLFAMGIGSYLSKFVGKNPLLPFIRIELLIGLIGGFSAPVLFEIFAFGTAFRFALYGILLTIGILVGLEIPLLMQILRERIEFKDLIAKVLTFDYIGALFVSILFPMLFVPSLGLVRTSLFFGILNTVVALWAIVLLEERQAGLRPLKAIGLCSLFALVVAFAYSDALVEHAEAALYPGEIIYARSSAYQRVIVTGAKDDLRLYLNGHLQFSSRDEYRYHEALVHPLLQSVSQRKSILVLGGGDGLAIREILKYDDVEQVTLVDLDPSVTNLFRTAPMLRALNHDSLRSPKVKIVNKDAFVWMEEYSGTFDAVVIDFPDPTNFSVGKLYTTTFYQRLQKVLKPESVIAVQTTSPLVARKSFWCISTTIEAVGLKTLPYHTYVPSFGEWGFVLAGNRIPVPHFEKMPSGLRFLTAKVFSDLTHFPQDMERLPVKVNRLNSQELVHYYEAEWGPYEQFS